MGVIPKKTTPLTKFIRTGEGVLVFAFNLTMLIIPIVSNSLSPEDAVKWAGIVNGVAVICRTGLKVVAEVSKTTGIEPQPIGDLPSAVPSADVASNGGAPEVVTAPTQPVVVEGPTDPVVSDAASVVPSDDEEFASTPAVDDDAVVVPAPPVPVATVDTGATPDDDAVEAPAPAAAGTAQAAGPADPDVSDAEEFASVPPPGDDDDDSVVVGPPNGDQAGSLVPVGAGATGAPDPIVVNGGEQES
jgi:hypothetical protein